MIRCVVQKIPDTSLQRFIRIRNALDDGGGKTFRYGIIRASSGIKSAAVGSSQGGTEAAVIIHKVKVKYQHGKIAVFLRQKAIFTPGRQVDQGVFIDGMCVSVDFDGSTAAVKHV